MVRWIAAQEAPLQRRWLNWWFDLEYRVLVQWAPMRRFIGWLATVLTGRIVLRMAAEAEADVVVSTYPGTSEILGRLRRAGRLTVPACSAITDLSALWLWSHPAIDLHLITHGESVDEVRAIAPRSRIVWARGMTKPEFERPLTQAGARTALGLPAEGGIVLVSGGGWGVGDMGGAIETTLTVEGVARVLVLCGRSEALMARLRARFGSEERVELLGFTERMSELMGAAEGWRDVIRRHGFERALLPRSWPLSTMLDGEAGCQPDAGQQPKEQAHGSARSRYSGVTPRTSSGVAHWP